MMENSVYLHNGDSAMRNIITPGKTRHIRSDILDVRLFLNGKCFGKLNGLC